MIGLGWIRIPLLLMGGTLVVLAADLSALEATKAAIRVLRDECINCHKPGKTRGGLLLHEREKLLEGGDSGEAIVPGDADRSLLYELVLADGDPHMPPKKQLANEQIEALRNWIEAGAAWDDSVFDELPPAPEVELVEMHDSYRPVMALALSPDESRLAVARGNEVLVVDLAGETRRLVARLSEHLERVESLVWTPDGKRLIAGGYQRLVIWEPATCRTAVIGAPLVGKVTALAAGEGGNLFAADGITGGAGFVHEFSLPAGDHSATWKAHDDTVYAMALSPDGQRLLTGGADKLAKLWEVNSSERLAVFEGHTSHVLAVAFDPRGGRVASAGADREIKLWDLESREQIISTGTGKASYVGLDWVDGGEALVAMTEAGGGSIYTDFEAHDGAQRSTGAKEKALAGVGEDLTSVRAVADRSRVFGGGFDGKVHEWDGKTGKILGEVSFQNEAPEHPEE